MQFHSLFPPLFGDLIALDLVILYLQGPNIRQKTDNQTNSTVKYHLFVYDSSTTVARIKKQQFLQIQ